MIVSSQNEARQSKISAATPEKTEPSTNPTGLPAEKHAKAQFLRLQGTAYEAPRMPTEGGIAAADQRPRRPLKTSMYMAFVAKPVMSVVTVKAPRLKTRRGFRPKVSAHFAKKRRKAPDVSL